MSLSILERLCAFDEGSCISLVLEKLSVQDLVQSGGACTVMNKAACQELQRRADKWKQEVSLGWSVGKNEEGKHVYAYEVCFGCARNALNDYLKEISPTKDALLENIVSWSGGWGLFLHARETRAREQPNYYSLYHELVLNNNPAPIMDLREAGGVATLGQLDRCVWIHDIKCDGDLIASAILPGGCGFSDFPYNLSGELPFFSNLGDEIDLGTCYNYNMQQHSKWFLSTDASDARTWTVNVSVVAPTCSETLFNSKSIIPRERIAEVDRAGAWVEYSFAGIENAKNYLDKEFLAANDGKNDHFHKVSVAHGTFIFRATAYSTFYAHLDRRPLHRERFHLMFTPPELHDVGMDNLIVHPPMRTKRIVPALEIQVGKKPKKYRSIFWGRNRPGN